MGQISEKTLTEVMLHLNEFGEPATLQKYKITLESLNRYKRKHRWEKTRLPKVLLWDVETTPMEVYVWGLFGNKYINHGNIIKDWNILSWAAKWLFSADMMSDILTPEEARSRDDKRIMEGIWKLLNEADIVIGHNSRKFDHKKLNTRFIMNNYGPPMPYQTIDTLEVSRRHFNFASNRLDYLGQLMTNKGKIETNFQLWTDCLAGNQEQLDFMKKYNEMDVLLLEEVYVQLRPWIKSHPNMNIYMESTEPGCGNCGSNDVTEGKEYITTANRYMAYRCNNCGAIMRGRISELSKDERKSLLLPVAR